MAEELVQGPNDLLLERKLKAPRALLWLCWTTPELLMQWFCPKPWFVSECSIDLRPGGVFATTMRGPDGEVFPNEGLYLEVVPQERLVTTDMLTRGWRPSENPFMVAVVTFVDLPGGGTHYRALAMHRSPEDRDKHAAMGFEQGWGTAAAQLDDLALSLTA